MLGYIRWAVDPEVISGLPVRWYGLLFGVGFLIGYNILEKMYKREGADPKWVEKLFYTVFIATIVGARLGHVFFYAWDYYSQNLWEIIMVNKGGLASHGGALAIIIGVWFYAKKVTGRSYLWSMDRLIIPAALVCSFIRLGNLFNSEIYGVETSLPWGIIFELRGETVPKHPTQLYEALAYFITFLALRYFYKTKQYKDRAGFLLGVLFIGVFLSRFFIEFIKNDQVDFESTMSLNMGQWLSIPFVIAGISLIVNAMMRPPKIYEPIQSEESLPSSRAERRRKAKK